MCQYNKKAVLPFLQTHDKYKLDTCISYTEQYSITEGMAYLYERAGNISGSLNILLADIRKQISDLGTVEVISIHFLTRSLLKKFKKTLYSK